MDMGEKLKQQRKKSGLTQAELANEILCFLLGLWTTLFLVDQWLNMDLLLPLILCSVSAFGFYYQIKERGRIGK